MKRSTLKKFVISILLVNNIIANLPLQIVFADETTTVAASTVVDPDDTDSNIATSINISDTDSESESAVLGNTSKADSYCQTLFSYYASINHEMYVTTTIGENTTYELDSDLVSQINNNFKGILLIETRGDSANKVVYADYTFANGYVIRAEYPVEAAFLPSEYGSEATRFWIGTISNPTEDDASTWTATATANYNVYDSDHSMYDEIAELLDHLSNLGVARKDVDLGVDISNPGSNMGPHVKLQNCKDESISKQVYNAIHSDLASNMASQTTGLDKPTVEDGETEDEDETLLISKHFVNDSGGSLYTTQDHLLAFQQNLVASHYIIPTKHTLEDILTQTDIHDALYNIQQSEGKSVAIYSYSGSVTPIAYTPLYCNTAGMADINSMRKATVDDLFQYNISSPLTFYILYHEWEEDDSSEEGGAYKTQAQQVYKYDAYTNAYMTMASSLYPSLPTDLEAFGSVELEIDVYGNIVTSADATKPHVVIIPTIANSMFINNKVMLYNRILLASYAYTETQTFYSNTVDAAGNDKTDITAATMESTLLESVADTTKFVLYSMENLTDYNTLDKLKSEFLDKKISSANNSFPTKDRISDLFTHATLNGFTTSASTDTDPDADVSDILFYTQGAGTVKDVKYYHSLFQTGDCDVNRPYTDHAALSTTGNTYSTFFPKVLEKDDIPAGDAPGLFRQTITLDDGQVVTYYRLDFNNTKSDFQKFQTGSVTESNWLSDIGDQEVAIFSAINQTYLINASAKDGKNSLLDHYCNFTEEAESNTGDVNLATAFESSCYVYAFLRATGVRFGEGDLTDADGNTINDTQAKNEEYAANILYYMDTILGDLGASLTSIFTLRMSNEYNNVTESSSFNLLFQVDELYKDDIIVLIFRYYIGAIIFLNSVWSILRILHLFGSEPGQIYEYFKTLVKTIAISTLPIIMLFSFVTLANYATAKIFSNTFLYWSGLVLEMKNIESADEDSFANIVTNFLEKTASNSYATSIENTRVTYIPSSSLYLDGKYETEDVSLNDLRLGIERSIETSISSSNPVNIKNRLMLNTDDYCDNLFYYFYDVLRVHYWRYTDSLGGTVADGFFETTENASGMNTTRGNVITMLTDPQFLYGQSYIDNADEIGNFEEASLKDLQKLQVQDICGLTELFSSSDNNSIVDVSFYNEISTSPWYKVLYRSEVATDTFLDTAISSLAAEDEDFNYISPNYYNGDSGIGSATTPGVIYGCSALYPEDYTPTTVETTFNTINKNVAQKLLLLQDYHEVFCDETILQMAALVMTMEFNSTMSKSMRTHQDLEPTTFQGKTFSLDVVFRSLFVPQVATLREALIDGDLMTIIKTHGGIIVQILTLVTLFIGQLAGIVKYLVILLILLLSMLVFLVVYNVARDFFSKAWLGLTCLYGAQLGIHIIFLIALSWLCVPQDAKLVTSIFQNYSGGIKVFVLLILFIIQIVLLGWLFIFAVKHSWDLGGEIITAKAQELVANAKQLFNHGDSDIYLDNGNTKSENVDLTTESTETQVNEADITANTANSNSDVENARNEANEAISSEQQAMEEANLEIENAETATIDSEDTSIDSESTEVTNDDDDPEESLVNTDTNNLTSEFTNNSESISNPEVSSTSETAQQNNNSNTVNNPDLVNNSDINNNSDLVNTNANTNFSTSTNTANLNTDSSTAMSKPSNTNSKSTSKDNVNSIKEDAVYNIAGGGLTGATAVAAMEEVQEADTMPAEMLDSPDDVRSEIQKDDNSDEKSESLHHVNDKTINSAVNKYSGDSTMFDLEDDDNTTSSNPNPTVVNTTQPNVVSTPVEQASAADTLSKHNQRMSNTIDSNYSERQTDSEADLQSTPELYSSDLDTSEEEQTPKVSERLDNIKDVLERQEGTHFDDIE